jgi:hypothetical protein
VSAALLVLAAFLASTSRPTALTRARGHTSSPRDNESSWVLLFGGGAFVCTSTLQPLRARARR